MKKTLYFCFLILSISAVAHSQQMYRWTDSKGVVHYTEYAPDETREQILNIDPNKPPPKRTAQDVKKLDRMQPTQAVLMEIEEKRRFSPEEQRAGGSGQVVATAIDPKTMTYCQLIHTNLATFDSLERGDLDRVLLISQSGSQSRLSPEETQAHYKSTIDNLEKYCLQ